MLRTFLLKVPSKTKVKAYTDDIITVRAPHRLFWVSNKAMPCGALAVTFPVPRPLLCH